MLSQHLPVTTPGGQRSTTNYPDKTQGKLPILGRLGKKGLSPRDIERSLLLYSCFLIGSFFI